MTPPPLPEDDGQPIKPPGTVKAATVLAMLGGLICLIVGGYTLLTTDELLSAAVSSYNQEITNCTTQFQGIGDAVVIPAGASEEVNASATTCKSLQVLTEDMISSAKTQNVVFSALVVVIGLLAMVGGWFMQAGARWSRLAVTGAVIISVILTMAFAFSTLLTLAATLLMIVSVMLCFVGKGAVYFARLKARRAG